MNRAPLNRDPDPREGGPADATRWAVEDAVARERVRISRELHDQVASDLAGSIALFKQYMERHRGEDDKLDTILEALVAVLAGLRETIRSLRPRHRLGDASLEDELRKVAAEVGRLYSIRVEVWTSGTEMALTPGEREVVFQVVREALTNVRKHSSSTVAKVRLGFAARPFLIEITDEGRGFDRESVSGYGMVGMRERAAGIGGRLEVVSTPGKGTTVFLFGPDPVAP